MTGSWCVGHLRFPLSTVFTNLASGGSVSQLVDDFCINASEVTPVLKFLADNLGGAKQRPA